MTRRNMRNMMIDQRIFLSDRPDAIELNQEAKRHE